MWHLFDRYKGVVWPKARQLNLIAKILNNLCQGTGIKLKTPTVPSPSAPVTISVDTDWLEEWLEGGGHGGVSTPWTVRYHVPTPEEDGETQPGGQWEVFIPAGAASCGSACYVINTPASATEGHEDDEAGWYAIPLDEDDAVAFRIVAHIKERCSMISGGSPSQAAPFVAVFAEPGTVSNPLSDSNVKTHYPGDVWSSTIATVAIESETVDNETFFTRTIRRALSSAVALPGTSPTWFRPVWRFSFDGDDAATPLTLDGIHLEDRSVYVGGVRAEADDDDFDETAARVYLLIDTAGAAPAVSIVPKTSSDSTPTSTAALQYVEILEFTDARLTSDLRLNLTNLPYYRGLA